MKMEAFLLLIALSGLVMAINGQTDTYRVQRSAITIVGGAENTSTYHVDHSAIDQKVGTANSTRFDVCEGLWCKTNILFPELTFISQNITFTENVYALYCTEDSTADSATGFLWSGMALISLIMTILVVLGMFGQRKVEEVA